MQYGERIRGERLEPGRTIGKLVEGLEQESDNKEPEG